MITYNHQDYIAEAIDSVLKQAVNFKIALIIGEDYSTDNTRNICLKYAEKHPDLITVIPADKNVGMMKNYLRTIHECDGKYVAYIEGDDYWTDPLKLQKQIDFLEANPNYSACFHNVTMKEERTGQFKQERNPGSDEWILHKSLHKDSFDTADVLGPWFIPSPSLVFVNYPDFELPDWFFNCTYGDLPFMLLLSLRGKFKYINEAMAVYRLHDKGATTVHAGYDKIMLMVYIYASFDIHTKYKYHQTIRNSVIYEVDRHTPAKELQHYGLKKTFIISLKKYLKKIALN
jgi:glycosyltransferase involved in cell wall biosynthesis